VREGRRDKHSGEKEIDDLRLRYGRTNYGRVVTAVIETIIFN